MAEYPIFPTMVVSVAPDRTKMLKQDDMETLCHAFRMATGVDPLVAQRPLKEIWAQVFREFTG